MVPAINETGKFIVKEVKRIRMNWVLEGGKFLLVDSKRNTIFLKELLKLIESNDGLSKTEIFFPSLTESFSN